MERERGGERERGRLLKTMKSLIAESLNIFGIQQRSITVGSGGQYGYTFLSSPLTRADIMYITRVVK